LASEYCYDIEVKKAIERHQEGCARIISIILRPCDWDSCDFSKFQAVPKDAKPITQWDDKDIAWLDVVNRLKQYIKDFSPKSGAMSDMNSQVIRLSDFQMVWLDDTEIVLTHRKVDKVKLCDIYVSPDLESNKNIKNKEFEIFSSDNILISAGYYLLSGEEQQGKTALLKHAFKELLKKEYLPIYIDSKNIKQYDLEKYLSHEIQKQYVNLTYEKYNSSERKVALIDNFDEICLNHKYRNIFLEEINKNFEWVIITCHSSYSYISSETPSLNDYKELDILGFGNYKREEIAKKWISLGIEESIDDSDLYSQCDELKAQLNSIIKRNIVPPKPIYILMFMQMFEAYAQQNLELSSYGHCYQHLIYTCFDKAGIKNKDYEKYLNVLTEVAWAIFKGRAGLNQHQLEMFFKEYNNIFLPVKETEIISNLIYCSILTNNDYLIEFKYQYIYYFFVGKKIAEGFYQSDEIKVDVRTLLENLHREDYANILIFITHHTKDSWVLDEIKEILSLLYQDHSKASLDKEQLSFMDDFVKLIPDLVLEQKEVQKERDEHNKNLDEIERNHDSNSFDNADILSNINKTFKGMEIAGQIIRNRHATMTVKALYELANNGVSTGLRFLDYFITLSDASKNEIVKYIELQLAEHPNLTDRQIQNFAKNAYLQLTYGIINGVVRKIASSIGSKDAAEIYNQLEEQEKTPAYALINQSIELQFKRVVDIASITKTVEKLRNNPVCLRILKEMVIQHTYMFPVEYRTKQQLAQLLDISIQGQLLMDMKKLGKG
jgi:DNA-binding transcriptional MerR regulator